jgi:hypothetical protein
MSDAYPESYPLSADQEEGDDPEAFAQEAGIDPTMQEVDEYREMIGDATPDADSRTSLTESTPGLGADGAEPGEPTGTVGQSDHSHDTGAG